MATLARFIGIDKYADPVVSNLTGARRDALALWALFSDNLGNIDAQALIDSEATVAAIRRALDETLGAAGPEDSVILSFACHGTRDHRLVAHDTARAALQATTIPMDELAERFRKTLAKSVILILDCCFSGGAPARVLDDTPIVRSSVSPLAEIVGDGRILIAASDIDEPALEHPRRRHGLLTYTLIQVLQSLAEPVSLTAAMDEVQKKVRIEADRMGYKQTPVLLGHITGGLTLPSLRPGNNYFTAFPEAKGARVSTAIQELEAFGIPTSITAAWSTRYPGGLNQLQLEAINEYRILDGQSLLVVAPTSSGKTFVGELAAAQAITQGRRAVFLLPYRALANEKYDQFTALYGETLGMTVIRCTGDYSDQADAFVRGKYDLALLTYEMFLNLTVANRGALNQVGLVVLDEGQFITDPNRGISVELLLTQLISARSREVDPQLLVLSAVMGDVNDFDAWLGCRKLVSDVRPVPLIEGVLDRSGVYQFLDLTGQVREEKLLLPQEVMVRRDKPSSQDVIVPLARKLIATGEQLIVFRNQKGKALGCARYLANDLGLPAATTALSQLPSGDQSDSSAALRDSLRGGTAFHNANLTREERVVVEQAFRDPKGGVRILGATTTVAAGINTPASTVILAEQQFLGEDGRPFTIAEYKNMAGRAGRLGYNEEGKSIILAGNAYERRELFQRYVQGTLEPLRSSFDPQHIDTWLIRLLAQVERIPAPEVVSLLSSTYGGYLAGRSNPDWTKDTAHHLTELLKQMLELELVEQEGPFIRLSLLGRACGNSTLAFGSAMLLVDQLRRLGAEQLNPETLMAVLQVLPESDGGYTPMFRRGQKEATRQREAASRYGEPTVRMLQRHSSDMFEYYARCKRAAILWDWTRGVPTADIERAYTTTPFAGSIGYGDIRRFADNTRYQLRAAYQIASILFLGAGLDDAGIDALSKQLEFGIPEKALGLLQLPVPLSRGEYLTMINRGILSSKDIATAEPGTLTQILGEERANRIHEQL